MMEPFIYLGLFLAGYLLCYFTRPERPQERSKSLKEDPTALLVKRNKPSLRDPQRTTKIAYEKYKGSETGLYEPVRPKSESKEGVELGK